MVNNIGIIAEEFMKEVMTSIHRHEPSKEAKWDYEWSTLPNWLLSDFSDYKFKRIRNFTMGNLILTRSKIWLPELTGKGYTYAISHEGEPFVSKLEKRVGDLLSFGVELKPRFENLTFEGKNIITPDLAQPYDAMGIITYDTREKSKYATRLESDSVMAYAFFDLIRKKVSLSETYPFEKQAGLCGNSYFAAEPALMRINNLPDMQMKEGIDKFIDEIYRTREDCSASHVPENEKQENDNSRTGLFKKLFK